MPLGAKQLQTIRESTTTKYRCLWDGAIRSGKTIASLIAWLDWLPNAPRSGGLAIIGKTRATIGRNILEAINGIDHRAIRSWSEKSESAIIMGRRVYLIGANDAQAEAKLRGLTLAGAYVDEATLIPEPFWRQLLGRLSVPGSRLFATTNPDNPSHWLKTYFIDRIDELGDDWAFWHFVMDDNPSLEPERIEAWKREFTGLWYRRFIEGEWVSAEGAVFDMWDPQTMVVKWEDIPPVVDFIATGIDYGTTNPTAAIALALCEDGRLYAANEKRVTAAGNQGRYTDSQQAQIILSWLNNTELAPGCDLKPRWTIIDPAAASFKVQMNMDGAWNIQDAYNDVLYGIHLVANGLAAGWLKIADTCTDLIKEIPGYSWDPKAEAAGIDKPIKTADHSIDAFRYAVATTESRWRSTIDTYVRGGHYAIAR